MSRFTARHVTFREACAFIAAHHRHHRPPQGMIVCLGLYEDGRLVGVGTLGRPVARRADDGATAEVTRCCVVPEARHAASALDARLRRLAQALGYDRTLTYTLESEGGASLRAAGARRLGKSAGGEWSRPSREREAAAVPEPKVRWCWDHPAPPLRVGCAAEVLRRVGRSGRKRILIVSTGAMTAEAEAGE